MLVAALQMQPAGSAAANLAEIEGAAQAAAAMGAALLVAPEMSVTGYAIWHDMARFAEPRDGAIVTSLAGIASRHGVCLVAGFPERDGAQVYNTAVFMRPDGSCVFYRKCHLFGRHEKVAFASSRSLSPIFDVGGLKAAMLICYDVEFPEMVRSLALAGAELILVPTALPRNAPANRVSLSMVPTRAFENHVFVIYSGLCGIENQTPYQGGSTIAGPDGEILARAGMGPTLLITRLEPERYRDAKLDPYLEDRLPDVYSGLM